MLYEVITMQVFGSKGWAEVSGIEHLPTWDLKVCFVDFQNPHVHQNPQIMHFESMRTERAELENFAEAAMERRPLAVAGGDEAHGVRITSYNVCYTKLLRCRSSMRSEG